MSFLLFAALVLCACVALYPTPLPWYTTTPIPPTQTPTATIVWFPPTSTATPLPTATLSITPTIDTRPHYSGLLFADDFSDPSHWFTGKSSSGSIALGMNELTLAVSTERGYLFTLNRNVQLGDFYLEITANPTICRSADEYGVLFRVAGSMDLFRFALTCDGKARLDRVLNSQAASLQAPRMYSVIPPGAPSSSRIAIWALGREMRFYVNGTYIFCVRDPSLTKGSLGVFVRAVSSKVVTVNFSNLVVYEAIK